MKKLLLNTLSLAIWLVACEQAEKTSQSLQYFDLDEVELLDSPFKNAQQLDKKYLLDLEADRLLAPFLREAGLEPKAESYTNWENTGLDGHIGGHYLSALAMMYASTGDADIKARLDYMLSELKRCQDANGNGYIGGVPDGEKAWDEVASGDIRAGGFSLNDRWVPLYNIHKTYAGLRDAYLFAGSEEAKLMLVKLTDWMIGIVSQLSKEQIQDMLRSEHGGLNETFADVAAITGDEKYLTLAKQFSHQVVLDPLLKGEDHLTGMHANTQIPKVIGFQRVAEINGDSSWTNAAAYFWDKVVEQRSVVIGGNSAYEHFHPSDDFSRMMQGTQGPETCNTYNMLRLSKMLYQDSEDVNYVDYYERALYNHILSSQHPETGGLVYFTQMRPGHYRVYSQPETSFWCCVGSGIENHAKYGEMIYASKGDALYVNLFIPSRLNWEENGVTIVQENNFPEEASTQLTIEKASTFTLKLRIPKWVAGGDVSVSVNGEPVEGEVIDSYFTLSRDWSAGDIIKMEMPMELNAEQLPDGSNYYAFTFGPVVLAAKTGTDDMPGLFADDSRGGHIAQGKIIPMKDVPVLVSEADQVEAKVSPVEGEALRFKIEGLHADGFESLELMPFYDLHEARYMIYFPQANEKELAERMAQIEAEEEARKKLDDQSVDVVLCGQQQPESDHFIKNKDTWIGYLFDEHYREGSGWFSYKMRNPSREAKKLYVKYLDVDHRRGTEIYLNDQKVSELDLDAKSEEQLNELIVDIPADLQKESTLQLKIQSKEKLWMTKIVEVRLLK
ncbi:glycoside hydrolase family 127 protein [Reichenbachiella ulvae]|uniref:Glycoside hydrolase family 127 protein n=1 Tax=Reichenbachiella ulvae TaxID=2980104 RepID=A0ABT3CZQ8_9BACT|nr:glycoside hydrolase family 127 protein [Reichenbachiella ulvae]MCV9389165.1 glycoside hydrolase family 127 protein [Reichenbachiella ulvae]